MGLRHKEKKYQRKSEETKKLEKINQIIEKMREDEAKAEAERKSRLEELEKTKAKKKAEKLKKEMEKKVRLEKQKMLGRRWEMLRWLTSFLKENQEVWEENRIKR